MRIEEWLPVFLTSHVARHPGIAWPEMGSEQFLELAKVWRYQLVASGVTRDVADDASYGLAGVEHKEGNHLAIFMRLCREIAKRKADQSSGVESDPAKAAARESEGCPDCCGSGWASRFVHADIRGKPNNARGEPVPVGASVAIPCGCSLGRHLTSANGFRLTVADYPSLRLRPVTWSDAPDNRYRHRPSAWDGDSGMPLDAGLVVATPAKLRDLCQSLAEPIRPPVTRPAALVAPSDPVIDREQRRESAPPRDVVMPEDDWTRWP